MRHVMRRHRFLLSALVASMLLVGCATDEASREGCGEGTSCNTLSPSSSADAKSASLEARLAQLNAFQPDDSLAGEQCAELSASNGTVQLDATASLLSAGLQQSTPVGAEELHLVVNFGSGLPSFTCTDVESEVHRAIVDETRPATAAGGIFTVMAGDRCSVASLALRHVVARSPDGQQVDLGDIVLKNDAWRWWHPFEYRLDNAPTG